MRFSCKSCKAQYSIADEKIRGKVIKVRCKKCNRLLVVRDETGDEFNQSPKTQDNVANKATLEQEFDRAFDGILTARQTKEERYSAGAMDLEPVWYCGLDGSEEGPLTLLDIEERARDGRITQEHFVWRDGLEDWLPIEECSELAYLFRFKPPPTPSSAKPKTTAQEQKYRAKEEERHRAKEEEKHRAKEEERRRAKEEERRRAKEEERRRAKEEERRRAKEEERRRAKEEERRRAKEEERRRAKEEERHRAKEEEKHRAKEEERHRAKEEEKHRAKEEEKKSKAEANKRKAEEKKRRAAEEKKRKAEDKERRRKRKEEILQREAQEQILQKEEEIQRRIEDERLLIQEQKRQQKEELTKQKRALKNKSTFQQDKPTSQQPDSASQAAHEDPSTDTFKRVETDVHTRQISEDFFTSGERPKGQQELLPPPPVVDLEAADAARMLAEEVDNERDSQDELESIGSKREEWGEISRVIAKQAGVSSQGRRSVVGLLMVILVLACLVSLVALALSQGWFSNEFDHFHQRKTEQNPYALNPQVSAKLSSEDHQRISGIWTVEEKRKQQNKQRARPAIPDPLAMNLPQNEDQKPKVLSKDQKELMAFYEQQNEQKRELTPRGPMATPNSMAKIDMPTTSVNFNMEANLEKKIEATPNERDPLSGSRQLTQEQIKQVINRHKRQIQKCLERQLKRDPVLTGKALVMAIVLPDGTVKQVVIEPAKFHGTYLEECMMREIKLWRFPSFQGEPYNLQFPFILKAQESY